MGDDEVFSVYDAGYAAAKRGGSEEECPHAADDDARRYWMNGFEDGEGA